MGGARAAVLSAYLLTLVALAWLVSVQPSDPAEALTFVYPSTHLSQRKTVTRVQVRRETRDPRDRLLRVAWFVDGAEAGGFEVQIDETTGWAMPMEPRRVVLEESGAYEFVADLVMVDGAERRSRAVARWSMRVCCPR